MTRIALQVATWAVAALMAVLLLVVILIPRLTGWVPLTVLSGSMEPTIPTGSLVVVERLHGEADLTGIGTGDVITFMPHPDDPTLVTHRVVSAGTRADGTTVFVTQGDANAAADPEPVGAQQVRGTVRYHVPYAGHLSRLLNVEQKRTGVFLAAALLFGYAGVQVVRALRPASSATEGVRLAHRRPMAGAHRSSR
ncbi:signal peptidase I [Ornithinicoccus halotolerans]|uniref:signal peptidase I n=1 Tax=Ornithinicoccus halotolerans TaxID=1748220 RepID=UPI0012968F1B|nr:signal peptidase I [Ornithinicoccus halotolerans]